jgi:alginate production protein
MPVDWRIVKLVSGALTAITLFVPGALRGDPGVSPQASTLTSGNGQDQVFDPDAPPKPRYEVLPGLFLGASTDIDVDAEINFDLDDEDADDVVVIEPVPQVVLSYGPWPWLVAFANLALSKEFAPVEEGRDRDRPWKLDLRQANLSFNQVLPLLNVRVGRQRYRDDREWLYDEDLDAFRLFFGRPQLHLEASVSRLRLVDKDLLNEESNEKVDNYFLTGHWIPWKDLELSGYVLARYGRTSSEERPVFLGVRVLGEVLHDLEHWLDAAFVTGEGAEDEESSARPDLAGLGLDVGTTYVFDVDPEPSLTLAFAWGSGERQVGGTDGNFRQTGLQENSDRFNGVTRFEYYGALFDPELSNLQIFTAGAGLRPLRRTSLDLVYHYYFQDVAADSILDSNLDEDPTGDSRSLGQEVDLVIGFEELKNLSLSLTIGSFLAGNAFPAGSDPAVLVAFESRYVF